MPARQQKRYAAKLLFQFRVVPKDGKSKRRRVCEERIILIAARSPRNALLAAKRRGKEEHHTYMDGGHRVSFEFVGVLGLVELGVESQSDEVWWSLREMISPMERRAKIIPDERKLSAFGLRHARGRLRVP